MAVLHAIIQLSAEWFAVALSWRFFGWRAALIVFLVLLATHMSERRLNDAEYGQ